MRREINFFYETTFVLPNEDRVGDWLKRACETEAFSIGELSYIFCDDKYLLNINKKHLNHDTYTDIITFDYSSGKELSGDIFISIERVKENATIFGSDISEELHRVMAHGVLHLMGYKDKSEAETRGMREKENEFLKLFHVEQ